MDLLQLHKQGLAYLLSTCQLVSSTRYRFGKRRGCRWKICRNRRACRKTYDETMDAQIPHMHKDFWTIWMIWIGQKVFWKCNVSGLDVPKGLKLIFKSQVRTKVHRLYNETRHAFGVTYCVLAPENELVDVITTEEYRTKVSEYVETV